jgi:hypothetical protein
MHISTVSYDTVPCPDGWVVADALDAVAMGTRRRLIEQTMMSRCSSRSQLVLTVDVDVATADYVRTGRLRLVELAGSERQKKTGCSGARLKDATMIALSLTSLSNVIVALASASASSKPVHVPYRNSKITRWGDMGCVDLWFSFPRE